MRSTIVGMTSLTEQLPYVYAFPDALGTGLLVHTESVLDDEIRDRIGSFIHEYEVVLSRFRDDSIVGRMRTAAHGGTFDFPDWASGLFGLYDRLFAATDGATDPCVGEDLIRLGYDESYSFTPAPDAAEHAGAIHGRAIWSADVERHGTTLVTRGPVALDFGACGKGYLVDLLAGMLGDGAGHPQVLFMVGVDILGIIGFNKIVALFRQHNIGGGLNSVEFLVAADPTLFALKTVQAAGKVTAVMHDADIIGIQVFGRPVQARQLAEIAVAL